MVHSEGHASLKVFASSPMRAPVPATGALAATLCGRPAVCLRQGRRVHRTQEILSSLWSRFRRARPSVSAYDLPKSAWRAVARERSHHDCIEVQGECVRRDADGSDGACTQVRKLPNGRRQRSSLGGQPVLPKQAAQLARSDRKFIEEAAMGGLAASWANSPSRKPQTIKSSVQAT